MEKLEKQNGWQSLGYFRQSELFPIKSFFLFKPSAFSLPPRLLIYKVDIQNRYYKYN
jgi:hypothetical protein